MTSRKYVCWDPTEGTGPATVRAVSPADAAKISVIIALGRNEEHDNKWSPSLVLVVDYETGDSEWVTVKVTVGVDSDAPDPSEGGGS